MDCVKENCRKTFNDTATLRAHLKSVHNMKKNDIYECSFTECRKKFNSSSNFYRHLELYHGLSKESVSNISHQIQYNDFQPDCINDLDDISIPLYDHNEELQIENLNGCNQENTDFDDIFFNFLTYMHSQSSLSRKIISTLYDKIKSDILNPVLNHINDNDIKEKIEKSYEKCSTFYKFKKEINKRNLMSSATQEIIHEKVGFQFKNGSPFYGSIKEKVTIMPIKQQIKTFFELPNIFEVIMENMRQLQNDETHLKNFIQGKLWKDIRQHFDKEEIVIPCFLYHDDFEPDNPLGSNAGSNRIAAFYFTFPVLPQHLLSSPKYVFDALLFSSDLKKEHIEEALLPLIQEFKELETEGIVLNVDGKEIRIYIIVSLLLGDNLAQNEMLGFSKSFNANFFCRFWKTSKKITAKECMIQNEKLRDLTTYEEDLINKQNGVMNNCSLNELHYFHAINNFSCDIMHDIFEGIARYDLALVLNYAIYERKIFNLWTLNKLKQEFDYGSIEIGNMGPEISETHIKNLSIVMSASEMRNFIHFLPLMIGHLFKDKAHETVWKLVLQLVEIADILMKSSLDYDEITNLNLLISSYLKGRLSIFKSNLKPKHHLMLHYEDCIYKSGPLHNLMCFSYEQKNRVVKKYSKICHQRINLSWSLMYKSVMNFNSFVNDHQNGFPSDVLYDLKTKPVKHADLMKKEYRFLELLQNNSKFYILEWMKYKGTLFKRNFYVAINSNEMKCFKIVEILKEDENYHLILEEIHIISYNVHASCYYVGESLKMFIAIPLEKLTYFPFNLHTTFEGQKAFRLKHI